MVTDWLPVLKERGELAKRLAKEVPAALSDRTITLEQVTKLYQVLEKQAQALEALVETIADDGAPDEVLDVAESLDTLYSDLAAGVANHMIKMRGP